MSALVEQAADQTTARDPQAFVALAGAWRSKAFASNRAGTWYGRTFEAGEMIASFIPSKAMLIDQHGRVIISGNIGVSTGFAPVATVNAEIAEWAQASGESAGSQAQFKAIRAVAAPIVARRTAEREAALAGRRAEYAAAQAAAEPVEPAWKARARMLGLVK